jgi:ABC-2 type transport system ATP-binding protein
MDSVVSAEGLTRVFRDFWGRPRVTAVRELSFDVARGEVVGLLGPNGAGKSTTVKMLLGLLAPTAGRLSVLGARPDDRVVKARMGYLPEESTLWPFLTARETLAFLGAVAGLPREVTRERAEQLLALVDLLGAADRRVGEYSKGMARRLALAQALLGDPELVVLDEPTSGLDPLGRRDTKEVIRALARRGKTVLLSSHLLGEVADVCDRVLILDAGRLVASGAVRDLLGPERDLESWFLEVLGEAPSRALPPFLGGPRP